MATSGGAELGRYPRSYLPLGQGDAKNLPPPVGTPDWISNHQFVLARQREEQHARIEREYLERLSSLATACQWLDDILSHPEQPQRARGWQVVRERDGPGSEPRDARWRGGRPRWRRDYQS